MSGFLGLERALDEVSYFQGSKMNVCSSRGSQCDKTQERTSVQFDLKSIEGPAPPPKIKIDRVSAQPKAGAKPL